MPKLYLAFLNNLKYVISKQIWCFICWREKDPIHFLKSNRTYSFKTLTILHRDFYIIENSSILFSQSWFEKCILNNIFSKFLVGLGSHYLEYSFKVLPIDIYDPIFCGNLKNILPILIFPLCTLDTGTQELNGEIFQVGMILFTFLLSMIHLSYSSLLLVVVHY